jgi:stage III sporulation protein AG
MTDRFWQRAGSWFDSEKMKGPWSTLFILALAVVGIIFMFISANPISGPAVLPPVGESSEALAPLKKPDYKKRLEQELTEHLRLVKGVGEVAVLVTLDSGPMYQYGENRDTTDRATREEDGGGGVRSIEETMTQTQVVVTKDGSAEQALITREIEPMLRGVMVVAKGAEDPALKARITLALQSGLNLPAHRITVLPMK